MLFTKRKYKYYGPILIISEIKRGIGRKSHLFHIPCVRRSAVRGPRPEYCHNVGAETIKMVYISEVVKFENVFIGFDTIDTTDSRLFKN